MSLLAMGDLLPPTLLSGFCNHLLFFVITEGCGKVNFITEGCSKVKGTVLLRLQTITMIFTTPIKGVHWNIVDY